MWGIIAARERPRLFRAPVEGRDPRRGCSILGSDEQLVFHRGAKVRADSNDFTFDDDTGLLEWAAPDRATVTLRDLDDAQEKLPTVVELVGRWIRADA
jgi:hypothetical protein